MNHNTQNNNIDASTKMALEEDKKDDVIMDVEDLGNDPVEDKKGEEKKVEQEETKNVETTL